VKGEGDESLVDRFHPAKLKATAQLAKTDSIDALVLARFAEAVRACACPLPDEVTLQLRALIAHSRSFSSAKCESHFFPTPSLPTEFTHRLIRHATFPPP
jgi:hypothetical protein